MRKKCPYSDLFWSALSSIRTEYGEILRISTYPVQMRKIRTGINPNKDTFYAVKIYEIGIILFTTFNYKVKRFGKLITNLISFL